MGKARGVLDFLRRYAGPLLIVLAILAGASYFIQVRGIERSFSCQAKYNSAFSQSLTLRSQSSNARQDAVDGLLGGVSTLILSAPKTDEEKAQAGAVYLELFRAYSDAKKENEAARSANPLPVIPDC